MAITSLKTFHKQPDTNRTGNTITASVTWILIVDDRITPIEADALLFSLGNNNVYGFPAFTNTVHPNNVSLRSLGYRCHRDDEAGYKFTTTVNYTNSISQRTQSEDPTDADPLYRSENVLVEREIDVDPITGKAIANPNGQPIIPKLTRTFNLKRFIVVRNERTYDDIRSQETQNNLNSDNFSIDGRNYKPRSVLMEFWNGEPAFDQEGKLYYVTTFKFLIDVNDLHQTSLIAVGTQPDANGTFPPGNIPGSVVTEPAKMQEDGTYFSETDQKDPTKFFIQKFWSTGELPLSFLRFRAIKGA